MPTIHRLSTCRIAMYAADHMPPHCHVLLNDGREVLVVLATGEVLRGAAAHRELAEALAWITTHRAELLARFEELQR